MFMLFLLVELVMLAVAIAKIVIISHYWRRMKIKRQLSR